MWTEEQIIQYDAIALADHSHVATWQERSRNGKSWKLSLNAEGVQGPLNQCSDLAEAKQKMQKTVEHSAITGHRNKPIPPGQQVRQRLDQQFEGLEEKDYRLEPRTGWRFYPSSRTTHSSSSSNWHQTATGSQFESGIRGKHHPRLNNNISFLFRVIISLARNLISWQSTVCVNRHIYCAPHFLMHSCCTGVSLFGCQCKQPHNDHHSLAWLKSRSTSSAFRPKTFTPHLRRAMSYIRT